jgi:hypothetical protein
MLTKEEIEEIERSWGDGNPQSVVCRLLAHIREQEAELDRRRDAINSTGRELVSLRETVRFLNDRVREQGSELAEAREFVTLVSEIRPASVDQRQRAAMWLSQTAPKETP